MPHSYPLAGTGGAGITSYLPLSTLVIAAAIILCLVLLAIGLHAWRTSSTSSFSVAHLTVLGAVLVALIGAGGAITSSAIAARATELSSRPERVTAAHASIARNCTPHRLPDRADRVVCRQEIYGYYDVEPGM